MDTSDSKDFKDKDNKANEDTAKENCSSLDRIMCQIVDELSLDMEWGLTECNLDVCNISEKVTSGMSVPENLLSHARSVLEGVKQSWLCGQYADTSLCGEQGAQARCHRFV